MNAIDRETILRLAGHRGRPAVSIYLPTHRETVLNQADRTLLRNLIQQVNGILTSSGLRRPDAESILAQALDLASDDAFWSGGFEGLAVFVHGNSTETVKTDITLPQRVVVGERLYLRPAFEALAPPEIFWVLALDRNDTRLFRADDGTFEAVELPPGTPRSFRDETKYDQRGEQSLQYRSIPASPGAPGRGAAMYHGHGGEKDVEKVEVEQFMRHLDDGVSERIGPHHEEPLVLLGVEYMIADFRNVSSHQHIAGTSVPGATDYLSKQEIHDLAMSAMEPSLAAATSSDLDELAEKMGTGLASADAAYIAASAADGRVKTLFLDDSDGPWGTLVGRPSDEAWDLVDLAAVETLAHDGVVHAFAAGASPVHGAAAVFRY
jgi:hypothetical protein